MDIPTIAPSDLTQGSHSVTFASGWLPTLIGILSDTLNNEYWGGTFEETEQAVTWMEELITMFMVGNE